MIKLIAAITAGLVAAGTMFASEECDQHVERCKASLASLNLEDGPTKRMLYSVLNGYRASNCSEDMENRVMKMARGELTSEQYEKFEAECKKAN
jgi:hypothetical protein